MNKFYAKIRTVLLVLFVPLSFISCFNSTPEAGTILWQKEIGGQFWAPLKHEGDVLYFGSDDLNFYAFDTATRKIKWKVKTGGIIRSAVDITDGIAVFASDDGFLYALDAESGNELWRFDLKSSTIARILPAIGPPYEYDYLHSSPKYHNGRIHIGSANGMLYSIDHKSGREYWHFKTSQKIRSTPVVDNDNVYFGSWDGSVYAVNIKSGQKVWQFDCGGIIQSSPAIGAGNIFVGSRSTKIFALDAKTGEEKWTYIHEDGSWVESSPVYRDGVVYIGSSDALKLSAFDAKTGQVKWEFKTGGWSWGTPTVANGVVYIGGISAYPYYFEGVDLVAGFYAVDQKSGKKIWSMTPKAVEGYVTGGVFSSGIITDGIVYVGALDGNLYALKE